MSNAAWYYNEETKELGCFVQGHRASVSFCIVERTGSQKHPSNLYAMNRCNDDAIQHVPKGYKPIGRLEFTIGCPEPTETKISITL